MIPRFLHILFFASIFLCYSESSDAQTLTRYVKQKRQELAEKQKIERQKYEQACKAGTLEAFKGYAKAYPNGKYKEEIDKRIEDFEMWSTASSENSISAYNQYLNNSKYKIFKDKADAAIKEFQAKDEWMKVKNSSDISDIDRFMSTYPNSLFIIEATKRKHELLAVSLYNSGELQSALIEFDQAGGRSSLSLSNRTLYDKCQEYYEYSRLTVFSKESDMESFLKRYPNSEYYNEISNRLALVKTKELTMYSTVYHLNSVLSYAKDADTRSKIRNYYEEKKRNYSHYKKVQRRMKRQGDGGIVNFGIELSDFALNPAGYQDDVDYFDIDYLFYYNIGLGIRFGNYRSPVQLVIGVKPGITFYTLWYGSTDKNKVSFHLPLYARLKVNLYDGDYAEWYIDGAGYYNSVKDSFLEGNYSISAGTGVSWRHWDWRVLYYKQDIGAKDTYSDSKFLGTSLEYYF